jgi:hypothetical protein
MSAHTSPFAVLWMSVGLALLLVPVSLTSAAGIFWTGPTITFTHAANTTTADMLTTNHVGADATNNVWLTRGTSQPLYNAAAESGWNAAISPANTLWAVASGPLTNADTLTYDIFANVVGSPGNSPGGSVGQTFYVKIISDNIYLSLTLTAWGSGNGGSFAYDRSTPASVAPPTPNATVDHPASGAVFAAPANVNITATAAVSSGTVTDVQFFANNTSLGSATTAPFSVTASNLAAGPYALTAVATASGISATSPAVNITVVNPAPVVISGVSVITNQINFNYTADTGLSYFVQRSSNFVTWTSFPTNVATSNPVAFSASLPLSSFKFYRVGQAPNP